MSFGYFNQTHISGSIRYPGVYHLQPTHRHIVVSGGTLIYLSPDLIFGFGAVVVLDAKKMVGFFRISFKRSFGGVEYFIVRVFFCL